MNEKSLEVLKQYDLNVYRAGRGRGGMILGTDSGVKLFLECARPDKYYEREDILTRAVADNGFKQVDTYIRNADGGLVTVDEDGRRYIVKNWFDGRECNVRDISDLCGAISTLGKLHTALDCAAAYLATAEHSVGEILATVEEISAAEAENGEAETAASAMPKSETQAGFKPGADGKKETPLRDTYTRHMKELKMASNYLKNKKKRSEFEMLAFQNINTFYEEAVGAVSMLNSEPFDERFENAKKTGELCHGSYNYHNVLFGSGTIAVTNFDKCKNECQISDLYQFMRKILEKYDWDIQVAYKMIDEYDKVKPINDTDLELLSALFAFPEKFWKVINYYFNTSKAWIPPKSIEKLKNVIAQNEKRQDFLATIM